MVYVARFTNNPEADIQRGWSAFMGERGNLWSAADMVMTQHGYDTNDYETEDEILEVLEEIGVEFRQYPENGEWAQFHHEGLSCWPLNATTTDDAICEAIALANNKKIEWAGFGSATEGKVEYICPVSGIENLHIFSCEDICGED